MRIIRQITKEILFMRSQPISNVTENDETHRMSFANDDTPVLQIEESKALDIRTMQKPKSSQMMVDR